VQKVAKEHLAAFKPHKASITTKLNLDNLDHLELLLKLRENELFKQLRTKMGKATVVTKMQKSALRALTEPLFRGQGVYDVWMFQEQDRVQVRNFIIIKTLTVLVKYYIDYFINLKTFSVQEFLVLLSSPFPCIYFYIF